MSTRNTLLWCATLLALAWLAHRASVEIVITHRLDLTPTINAVKPPTRR
jgi:hypothetical protein